MRNVNVIKEARKEILTKLVKLMELKKEIIKITLIEKVTKRNEDDKRVLGYLDNVIAKMQGQVNAITFVLNEDDNIKDYANEPFYRDRYGIDEDYVSGEYIESLRKLETEKLLEDALMSYVHIPRPPMVTPTIPAGCDLTDSPLVKETLKAVEGNKSLWFGN